MFTRLLCVIILTVLLDGCEPEFIPADPRVDFTVGELFSPYALGKDTVLVADTVLSQNWIVMEATGQYKSYQWQIGKDKRTFTGRRVKLFFESPVSKVDIKLTARTGLNTADSISVATKTISVVDYWENPIFGVFTGTNQSEPHDPFDVQILYDDSFRKVNVFNINRGCNPVVPTVGIQGFEVNVGYKKLFFSSGFYYQSCSDPSGWATLDRFGEKLTIDYTIGTGTGEHPESPRQQLHFTGNRKQ